MICVSFDNNTKRIIRILSGNVARLAHTELFFKEQEILTFNVLHKYQVAQFMFNFIKGDKSEVFVNVFKCNSNVHHYNTIQSHLLHIPAVSSNLEKRNFRYEGPVIWNELQNFMNIKLLIVFIQKAIEIDISEMLNSE